MIYFIKAASNGMIKIGTSVRLSARLKQLTDEHGDDLQVLAVADGSYAEETALHQRFTHLRVVGEWFKPGDDLLAFIAREGKSPKPDPEDVPKTLFAIKGRPSWHAWLKEYADSIGMDVLGAIDNALRHQAKRDEFERPMPRRMGKPRE